MATIKTSFLQGGSGLTPGKSAGTPDLTTALRDVADDLAGVKITAPVTAASAVTAVADGAHAAGANPTAGEFNAVVDLANDLKAKYNAAVTLLNEIRTNAIAAGGTTLKTIKG